MKNFWSLSAAGLALSFALAGCGTNNTTTATTDGTLTDTGTAPATGAMSNTKINAAGATFPYPIYTKWFSDYKAKTGVEINYQSVGSGAGIKQLKANTVDFAGSDAPLKDKDMKDMPGEVVQFPSVGGAVVVAYNVKGAPDNLKMDGPLIADIFMGKIKKWNDPRIAADNPGVNLPNVSINPAHRSDGSGTTAIFTTYLSQVSPEWKAKLGAGKTVDWPGGVGGKGNDGVTSAIQQGDGGIGYVELAYAMQNKLNVAAVKNPAGNYIVPSARNHDQRHRRRLAGRAKRHHRADFQRRRRAGLPDFGADLHFGLQAGQKPRTNQGDGRFPQVGDDRRSARSRQVGLRAAPASPRGHQHEGD